ncbi:MAG: [Bacteroidales bacterium]|nr:[FeFe] hydrogenase H-cluster radical SAM maturase HydE [Bacteroidales bacterium]
MDKQAFESILHKDILQRDDLITLLGAKGDNLKQLLDHALAVKLEHLDNNIHLRGLVEYSNTCRKNCKYCGLRVQNTKVVRYTVPDDEVLQCARIALEQGYGSMALQSGERTDREFVDGVERVVKAIKQLSGGKLGITLSCGEQSEETYRRWFEAGAHRYLLRIESSTRELYYTIHPHTPEHSFERRLECIDTLLRLGYQTGTGVMVGLPAQTLGHLADDLLFFRSKDVAMVGLGPFIPHPDTPLWELRDQIPSKEERIELTTKMIAALRIMMPEINMVSATANQLLDPQGRERAVLAGANVIMPNLTPNRYREEYLIYPDKANVGDRPEEAYRNLEARMNAINHSILYNEWGDSVAFTKRKQHTKGE